MDFLKVVKEVTCKVSETAKKKMAVISETATFIEVKVWSYQGSVSKQTLFNKGNFQMKIFNSSTREGITEYRNWLKVKDNVVLSIDSMNSESIRLAQNTNRVWDDVSEKAKLKNETLSIVKAVINGNYGKEAKAKAIADFPIADYPTLY